MIVDVHTHRFTRESMSAEVFVDMDRCGVGYDTWKLDDESYLAATAAADKVIVFWMKAAKTGYTNDNAAVAAFVARHPEKYIFFAGIDPYEPGYMEELVDCHQRLGCKGLKLGPIYQGVHPLDKRYYEIYAYCEKHGLPIVTHMATTFTSRVPLEYARPVHMDTVAMDFPNLKLVLAHVGHPWEGEALVTIRRNGNVYADVSALYYRPWQFYNTMRLAVEYNCHHKLLLGSDCPVTTTAQSIEGIRSMHAFAKKHNLPELPEQVLEDLINRDALTLLGL